MRYYYKNGFYCIEGLKEAGEKLWIAAETTSGILIAADENLHVSAWNTDTGQPLSELKKSYVLKTADEEENILISRDMQAVLKIKKADDALVIHDRLILAERSGGHFASSVYRLEDSRINGAEWKEEIDGCHVSGDRHSLLKAAFAVSLMYHGRIRKALITPQKTIFSFPPNMEFKEVSGEIAAFSQGKEIGLYDFHQEKELCRFRQEDETDHFACLEEFKFGSQVWVTPHRFYKDGKTGFFWEDKASLYRFLPKKLTGPVCLIGSAADHCKCRLMNVQTAQLSHYYRTANHCSGNCILIRDINGKYGIIDQNFREILPAVYDEIDYSEKTGLYCLLKESQYGIAGADGTLLTPAVWDNIEMPSGEYFTVCMTVTKDSKKSILLPDGSLLTSPEWDAADLIAFRTVSLWKYLPSKDDIPEQQKYFSLMRTDTKETLLEGIFDSIEPLAGDCLKIQQKNKTGVFSIYEKRWLSEPELCSVTAEGNRIVVQTVCKPERREFHAE